MNAGTHLGESCSRLMKVEACDLLKTPSGTLETYQGAKLSFEYRRNLFLSEGAVVYAAEWSVDQRAPAQVKALIDETLARRKATQPIDYPSCGSVFKNPKAHGLHAWQVIEKVGLKGHQVGEAQYSEKHCNFIVNLGKAKASDVYALIQMAKTRAREQLGIELEEEVRYLGTV
jgi:UDP-N-acetylmuramate dehydrogenase